MLEFETAEIHIILNHPKSTIFEHRYSICLHLNCLILKNSTQSDNNVHFGKKLETKKTISISDMKQRTLLLV